MVHWVLFCCQSKPSSLHSLWMPSQTCCLKAETFIIVSILYTDSLDHAGLRGPQDISSVIPCSKQGQHQTQMGLSQQGVKISRDGESVAPLGNLFHLLAILQGDMLITICVVWIFLLPAAVLSSCPPLPPHFPLCRQQGAVKCPKTVCNPNLTSPSPTDLMSPAKLTECI